MRLSTEKLRQYAKAGIAFVATTATYFWAKNAGILPVWFRSENYDDSERAISEISSANTFLSGMIDSGHAKTAQRRLLQQSGAVVAHPIPDQVIEVDKQYIYPLDSVFGGDYSLLGAVETGKNSLPSWLEIQYKLLSTYPAGSGNTFFEVAISGTTAFVASGFTGLQIFDVSNSSNLRLLSTFSLEVGGEAVGIAINGSTAFVTDYTAGLHIFNVSNTSHPQWLSTTYLGGAGNAEVAISGSMAFVANFIGLQIFDVSNLWGPWRLSTYSVIALGGAAYGIALSGDLAFLTISGIPGSLLIFNVSNPMAPQLLSAVPEDGYPASSRGMAISDSVLFVANRVGLKIFNVTNPNNPRMLSTFSAGSGGQALAVAISGSTVFVADMAVGVQILDVSIPSKPRFLGVAGSGSVQGVGISGNTVFAVGSAGLELLDVNQASLLGVPPISSLGQQVSITVAARNMSQELASDHFALILDQFPRAIAGSITDQNIYPGNSLTLIFDSELLFTNPSKSFLKLDVILSNGGTVPSWLKLQLLPIQLFSYPAGGQGYANSVVISGSTVFVANHINLQIFDVSNPSNTKLLTTFPVVADGNVDGNAYAIAISGSMLALVGEAIDIMLFDVSNLTNPRLLSSSHWGQNLGVAISGSTAFVANPLGLQILDVSNQSNPQLLFTYPPGTGQCRGVAISGNIAFVADYSAGLQIIEVSEPSNPRLISTYSLGTGENALGVAVSGNKAFVVGNFGTQILAVTNPGNPILLSTYSAGSGIANGIAISGNLAVVADYSAGLQILDISNPSKPQLLSTFPAGSGGYSNGVAISGSTVFVADGGAGLQILDLTHWQLTATPGLSDAGNYRLQLTTMDTMGNSLSTQPFTIRVEGPPQIHGNISVQYAKVGQVFDYFVPQGLFTDPNFDPISFSSTLINGLQLPSWLSFNGISGTFTGTPENQDVGNFSIFLSATDNIAGSVNTTFKLLVDHMPVVNQRLADQVMGIGLSNQLVILNATFFDQDGDALIYSAQRSNGLSLPSWLILNGVSGTFSGRPNSTDAGIYALQLTADDQRDGQVSVRFNLLVEYFPSINQLISAQGADVAAPYSLSVASSFIDLNSDALTYQASRNDGSALPSWLSFNVPGLLFSGVPTASDIGRFLVQLTASDSLGGSGVQYFNLTVSYFPRLNTPIRQQVGCIDSLYQFIISSTTFVGGTGAFTYTARQSNGQPLPVWLSLNSNLGRFSGAPSVTDVGHVTLALTATDTLDGYTSTEFDLFVTHCPTIQRTISSMITNINNPFGLTIAGDSFSDGGDALTYTASQIDGSALPNWLSFNPQNLVFSGVPLVSDIGIVSLELAASNLQGGVAVQNFTVTVCQFPSVATPLPTLPPLRDSRAFQFIIPNDTFNNPDQILLLYNVTKPDGNALPSWLSFARDSMILSGTPSLVDVGSLNIILTTENNPCLVAPMNLVIWQNYPPEVVQPLSNQLATVGTPFSLFVSPQTFTDRNNDPLTYTAEQSDGQSLPSWLHFDAQKLSFSGIPGRSDTDAFSERILKVALIANDNKLQTAANFNLNVQGVSNIALLIKIGGPLLSSLTGAYALYKQRARFLNRCKTICNKQVDQRIEVGQVFLYQINVSPEQVKKLSVKTPRQWQGCSRFFKVAREPLPGNKELPTWMYYDTNTNVLRSKGFVPVSSPKELIVQVKGEDDVTLEQFTLHVTPSAGLQGVEGKDAENPAEIEVQPMLSSLSL